MMDLRFRWGIVMYLNGRNIILAGDEDGHVYKMDPWTEQDTWDQITEYGREEK
jgi:hypothetical protein